MKIAYLSGALLPSQSANSVHVMKMCAALARQGHSVTLTGRRAPGATDAQIFEHYGVDRCFDLRLATSQTHVPRPRTAAFLALGLAPLQPDLCYVRYRPAGVLALLTGQRLVFEAHEFPKRLVDRFWEWLLLSSARLLRLVVISGPLAHDYKRSWPRRQSDLLIAHDGADPSSATCSKHTGTLRVGYVGSLFPGKGVEMVIALARERPQHTFHVVGGSQKDIEYWKAKSPDNVDYHGYVKHADLSEYYSSFNVALAPLGKRVSVDFSGSDIARWTSPLKIFEYMAHGLPLIATDTPNVSEVIENGVNGLLAPAGDVGLWVQSLDYIFNNPTTAEALGMRAHNDLTHLYSWDARAKNVLSGIEA